MRVASQHLTTVLTRVLTTVLRDNADLRLYAFDWRLVADDVTRNAFLHRKELNVYGADGE
jgi:hypothetical protein